MEDEWVGSMRTRDSNRCEFQVDSGGGRICMDPSTHHWQAAQRLTLQRWNSCNLPRMQMGTIASHDGAGGPIEQKNIAA